MERKDQLEELHLLLDVAVDHVGRAQRLSLAADTGLEGIGPRIEELYVRAAELRNAVRDALMKELASRPPGPRKLPVV